MIPAVLHPIVFLSAAKNLSFSLEEFVVVEPDCRIERSVLIDRIFRLETILIVPSGISNVKNMNRFPKKSLTPPKQLDIDN